MFNTEKVKIIEEIQDHLQRTNKIGNKISISKKSKKVPFLNISLSPAMCNKALPCKKDCYAMKSFNQYPNVRAAWSNNLAVYLSDSRGYFEQLSKELEKLSKKPKHKRFFRYHVAGDIVDQNYLNNMLNLAAKFPTIKFLAFTKRHELDYSGLDNHPNLTIVFSYWPNFGNADNDMPKAFLLDNKNYEQNYDTRMKESYKDMYVCSGSCKDCRVCWDLKDNEHVIFIKH
jgi:hypothetical protein